MTSLDAAAGGGWEQIPAEGKPVSWRRMLPDGSWLMVCKTRDGEAIAAGEIVHQQASGPWWMWMHCGLRLDVQASTGGFDLSRLARDAADRYLTEHDSPVAIDNHHVPGRPVTPLQTEVTEDEFEIPEMAEVAATAALTGVRSGDSVQIVRAVLAAGGPHLMAAELRHHAAAVDADRAQQLTASGRVALWIIARRLRDRAAELEQETL